MPLEAIIAEDYEGVSREAASAVIPQMRQTTIQEGRIFKLGLPDGDSTLGFFDIMVERQREFDASKVMTFNSYAHVGLLPNDPRSNLHQLSEHLFSRLNPQFLSTNFPEAWKIQPVMLETALAKATKGLKIVGTGSGKAILIDVENCDQPYLLEIKRELINSYLSEIRKMDPQIGKRSGIDWQVAGIGENGSFALHESGIPNIYRIMLVKLSDEMIESYASSRRFCREEVPKYALTLGVGYATGIKLYLSSRNVLVLASGEKKAQIVAQALLESPNDNVPISYLQKYINLPNNRRAVYVLDELAAIELLRHESQLRDRGIKVTYAPKLTTA